MPTIKYTNANSKERDKIIKAILPERTLVETLLIPEIMGEDMMQKLKVALLSEIEIYKAYPKEGKYEPKKFNPTSNQTCFMGQAFRANGLGMEGWHDDDLNEYRKAIGTINHKEWGDCTLMEIWGGDHFRKYPDMVKGVFLYCYGKKKYLPEITFYVNPLWRNKNSGSFELTSDQSEEKLAADHYIKLAAYIEIRDRLKTSGTQNLLDLSVNKEYDPKKGKR